MSDYIPTWAGPSSLRKLFAEQAQLVEAIRERAGRMIGNDAAWIESRKPRLAEIDAQIEALIASLKYSNLTGDQ